MVISQPDSKKKKKRRETVSTHLQSKVGGRKTLVRSMKSTAVMEIMVKKNMRFKQHEYESDCP